MLTGALPFKCNNNADTLRRLRHGKYIDSPFLLNDKTREFFNQIFDPKPENRLTITQIAKHSVVWQDKVSHLSLFYYFIVLNMIFFFKISLF